MPWYIIDPRASLRMRYWDMTTGVALVFTALVTPWEVSFLETPTLTLFACNRVVDAIFIADVFVQFLIMFPDFTAKEGRRWVTDPRRIAGRYLRGWFTFDVLTIAPMGFDIHSWAARAGDGGGGGSGDGAADLFVLRVVRTLKLVKLLRLVRGSRVLVRWKTRISVPSSSLRLLSAGLLVMIALHWMACVLMLQTTLPGVEQAQTWLVRFGHCWAAADATTAAARRRPRRVECSEPGVLWLYCLSWAFSLIGGLDTLPPRGTAAPLPPPRDGEGLTPSETVVLIVLMVGGALIWANVVATFVDIAVNAETEDRAHRNALDKLNRFLNLHNLPAEHPKLCQHLREYFQKSIHVHRARVHDSLYQLMSPRMRATVVGKIPWQQKWTGQLAGMLDAGGGLFRDGDRVRIEPPGGGGGGGSMVTHVASGAGGAAGL